MLESEAIVVKVERGATYVAAQVPGGCGSEDCATQTCSTAVLTRLFSQTPKPLRAKNPIDANVGERVMVGLEEGAFLKSSLLAYVLPLLALVLGAVLGMQLSGGTEQRDLYAALGGLAGLLFSALLLRILLPSVMMSGAQPTILRRL